jgi:amino acid transporter
VAALASALTGQAGASRLLFGMGRDRVLPRRIFAYIHPRFSTPTRSICLMGVLAALGTIFLRFQIAVELLNFGAFAGFILVNLSVIRHFFFRMRRRRGIDLVTNLVFPALGALVCFFLWTNLSNRAKVAGFIWLVLGAAYLAITTRGFRAAPASLASLSDGV